MPLMPAIIEIDEKPSLHLNNLDIIKEKNMNNFKYFIY